MTNPSPRSILALLIPAILLGSAASATTTAALASEPRALRILTYNIDGFLTDWAGPLRSILAKPRLKRLESACSKIRERSSSDSRWDAILIQEALAPRSKEILKGCGLAYMEEMDHGTNDSGLVVLSRFPIPQAKRLPFDLSEASDDSFKKSAIAVKIEPPGGKAFWIANLHLVSRDCKSDPDADLRRKHFRSFAQWLRQQVLESPDEPVIVGGDFNLSPPPGCSYDTLWDEVPAILPGFTQAKYPADTCTYCPPNTHVKTNEGKLDHLFGSPHFTAEEGRIEMDDRVSIDGDLMHRSDHFGWSTVFRWRSPY